MNNIRVVIRTDSSKIIGSGHLMRCLTLANELKARGVQVVFITRDHIGNLGNLLEDASYHVEYLNAPRVSLNTTLDEYSGWLGVTQDEDAAETIAFLTGKSYDWLVVDHYGLDIRWETQLRSVVKHIIVIDDLANRNHDCDILLDQNYFGAKTIARYNHKVGVSCQFLLGPRYALLQPEYFQLRPFVSIRDGYVRRVLVFFGGSDLSNHSERVLDAFNHPKLKHLVLDVVLGANHPNPGAIRSKIAARKRVTLHQNVPTLAGLMMRADLFIGAGGATTWERMSLGLPSLVVSTAENQREFTCALTEDGFQFSIGATASLSEWVDVIHEIIQNPISLEQLIKRAGALVDGLGVKRLVNILLESQWTIVNQKKENEFHNKTSQSLTISIISDLDSWFSDTVEQLKARWIEQGHQVVSVYHPSELVSGDVCFILSCSSILKSFHMNLHSYNLVVHGADLPNGRGWSPMTWQILEGRSEVCMTLFEATAEVDAGPIYAQKWVKLNGTELVDEWREKQARVIQELCVNWIEGFPDSAFNPREQIGEASYYPRRKLEDSELDPSKTLCEQFNLLRVVDNQRYPASFQMNGARYKLLIEREKRSE